VSNERQWRLTVAALGLGTVINPLSSSVFAVGLVTIRDEFDLDVTTVGWLLTVFYLTSAVAQPLIGSVADRLGPRRTLVAGMSLVTAACTLGPFAPAFEWLCVARALTAVGTAAAFPCAYALVRAQGESRSLGSMRALGRLQLSNSIGTALGPVIGGVALHQLDWRALFWITTPLAVACMAGVLACAPRDEPGAANGADRTRPDVLGVALFALTVLPLLIALSGFGSRTTALLIVVFVSSAVCLVRRETSHRSPFIDVRLLRSNRPLLIVYACFTALCTVYYCLFYGLPIYLEEGAGYETVQVGLLMATLAAVAAGVNPFVTRSLERRGSRPLIVTGMVSFAVTCPGLLLIAAEPRAAWLIVAAIAVVAACHGTSVLSLSRGLYESAPPQAMGMASGVFQTCRHIGATLSITVVGLTMAGGATAHTWVSTVSTMMVIALSASVLSTRWQPRGTSPVTIGAGA
jgi:MFS family permease